MTMVAWGRFMLLCISREVSVFVVDGVCGVADGKSVSY